MSSFMLSFWKNGLLHCHYQYVGHFIGKLKCVFVLKCNFSFTTRTLLIARWLSWFINRNSNSPPEKPLILCIYAGYKTYFFFLLNKCRVFEMKRNSSILLNSFWESLKGINRKSRGSNTEFAALLNGLLQVITQTRINIVDWFSFIALKLLHVWKSFNQILHPRG